MSEEAAIDTQQGLIAYMNSGVLVRGQSVRRDANGGLEMSVVVKGTIRGTAQELEMAVDPLGNQFTAFGDLPYTELSRLGQGYSTMATAAVAGLVVRPSTTAALELWNGGTTSLVVDRIFSFNLVASAIQGTYSVWAMVTTPKSAPSSAGIAISGDTGKNYSGGVITATSTTVVANGWFPYGTLPFGLGTATPGGMVDGDIKGRIIVPPNCSLCLHTVSQTTAWTFQNGAHWYEKAFSGQSNNALL